jgi:hypothetical protein
MDVLIKIKDREGVIHELQAPTDMAMNIPKRTKMNLKIFLTLRLYQNR